MAQQLRNNSQVVAGIIVKAYISKDVNVLSVPNQFKLIF